MQTFVWTKMQSAAGESLDKIIMRKEAERRAGNGDFWWGVGTSLGAAVNEAAASNGNTLPVLFSRMLSAPQEKDSNPQAVCVWQGWQSRDGRSGELPEHILITGGSNPEKPYYALICFSQAPLRLGNHGTFDPQQCRTLAGKVPGSSQVTALLQDSGPTPHRNGRYQIGFRCDLRAPWAVRLTGGRTLNTAQREALNRFSSGDCWLDLVRQLRG